MANNKNFLKRAKIVDSSFSKKYDNLYIVDYFQMSKTSSFYTVYNKDNGEVESYREDQLEIIGDAFIKNKNEIYPWDVYPEDDRIDKDYFDQIEDYENIIETKEDLVLEMLRIYTALLRAEEIMKRSLGMITEDKDSDDEKEAKIAAKTKQATPSKKTKTSKLVKSESGIKEMMKDYYSTANYTITSDSNISSAKIDILDLNNEEPKTSPF